MLGIENRQVKRLGVSGIFLKAIARPVNMCYLFRVISYGFATITCPFPGRFGRYIALGACNETDRHA